MVGKGALPEFNPEIIVFYHNLNFNRLMFSVHFFGGLMGAKWNINVTNRKRGPEARDWIENEAE